MLYKTQLLSDFDDFLSQHEFLGLKNIFEGYLNLTSLSVAQLPKLAGFQSVFLNSDLKQALHNISIVGNLSVMVMIDISKDVSLTADWVPTASAINMYQIEDRQVLEITSAWRFLFVSFRAGESGGLRWMSPTDWRVCGLGSKELAG